MNDVFLVSAIEDLEMADLVARRLRALKMKVTFDKKRGDRVFDSKDARAIEQTKAMLVLWSEAADQSDWVHAAARTGRARAEDGAMEYTLIQTALDDVTPRDPFGLDKRFSLKGFTARKPTDGWFDAVDALAMTQGRSDLREWQGFGTKDATQKTAWLAGHPTDPLALVGTASTAPQEQKPWPGPFDVAAAAGLPFGVASSLSLLSGVSDQTAEKVGGAGVTTLEQVAVLTREDAESLEAASGVRKGTIERQEWVLQARELLNGEEPRAKTDLDEWRVMQLEAYKAQGAGGGSGLAGMGAVAASGIAASAAFAPEARADVDTYAPETAIAAAPIAAAGAGHYDDGIRIGTITAILAAIGALFFLGWLFGKEERAHDGAILAQVCPAGTFPSSLAPLETGMIINDVD